jgi:hypothetical protein
MGVAITPHVFTQASKLRLMQRLIAALQNDEIAIADTPEAQWLVSELETFEFEYTPHGVRYTAPPGLHDDGVMALALALHGWDRVQGVVPEGSPEHPVLLRMDRDPYVDTDAAPSSAMKQMAGNFTAQLPGEGW